MKKRDNNAKITHASYCNPVFLLHIPVNSNGRITCRRFASRHCETFFPFQSTKPDQTNETLAGIYFHDAGREGEGMEGLERGRWGESDWLNRRNKQIFNLCSGDGCRRARHNIKVFKYYLKKKMMKCFVGEVCVGAPPTVSCVCVCVCVWYVGSRE